MISVAEHHPFGPSILASFDPKSRGCRVYQPSKEIHWKTPAGSLKHSAFANRDFTILEGDEQAEAEVRTAWAFINQETTKYDGPEDFEVYLKNEINFGHLDYLKFNRLGFRAFVGDLKFGEWPVTPANKNLQLLNYIVLVFDNYSRVEHVRGVIYHSKSRSATQVAYRRKSLPHLKERIAQIVAEATRAAVKPERADYTPSPTICGFCTRIACPARIELAQSLVAAWHQQPVVLTPTLNPAALDNRRLAELKRLGTAVRSFADAVDAEAKRRAVEEDSIIPGYVLTTRSGKRTIVGASHINHAQSVILDAWIEAYPETPLAVGELMLSLVEVGVGDLEKQIGQQAPRGEVTRAQKLIAKALMSAKLVEATPQIVLAPIKT